MLNRTLSPLRLAGISWAHLSVLLVGLMWLVPFIIPRHESPLTTFDQEWWSALFGLGAMTLLLANDFWRQPSVPRIAQLPAALVLIVLVQVGLNMVVYFEQGLLYILYLLFATLLMILGARLRASFGIEKLAIILAAFLVIGAELQAVAGLIQHYRWNTPLSPYVVLKMSFSVYGNMAQPNHFASYISIGLISIGLLFHLRKLKLGAVVLLALPLLFTIALSGSRSTWLYLFTTTLLAWVWTRRDTSMRPLLYYSLSILAGFGLMLFVVQLPFLAGADNMDVMRRMFQDHASGAVRLYLWKESIHIFLSAPLLGVGFGQYSLHHLQWVSILQPHNIQGLYNHAHNLVFQIAAETGLVGLFVLLGGLVLWLKGVYYARRSAAHWWGYAALAVLAIHSSLEYPLWYLYFVAVAAILLGMLDETHYELELRTMGRVSIAAILVLGSVSLFQIQRDYRSLQYTLSIRFVSGNTLETHQATVKGFWALQRGSLLSPYAELYLSTLQEIKADEHLKQKLLLNTNVMRFVSMPTVVYRQSFFLAMDNQLDAAKNVMEQAIWSYPGDVAAHQQLLSLAKSDPAHFAALLEFATQKEQEYARAVHQQ
ncbi:MAG: Wzy polymerase domain-containing protein [Gallionella sp.]|nr:Wzy polymerase domain-containing protein [Gallionella sp.]